MNLSNYDIAIIEAALKEFIFSEYEDIPKNEKVKLNDIALQSINKFKNGESDFNASHLSAIALSLNEFICYIEESTMPNDSDSKKYLNRANFLYNYFDKILDTI